MAGGVIDGREPHIGKGSRLDRLLNKSHPTLDDLRFMEADLSAIVDPTEAETRLLSIVRESANGKI